MKKILIALALTLNLFIGCTPQAMIALDVPAKPEESTPIPHQTTAPPSVTGESFDGFEYEAIGGGACKITGYTGENAENLRIPGRINGLIVTEIGNSAFAHNSALAGELILPGGVESIGDNAFAYCNYLTGVTLPSGLRLIGVNAFYECVQLEGNITIPASVTIIGKDAFYACFHLAAIEVAGQNLNFSSLDGILFNKDKTELIKAPEGIEIEDFAIPGSVTKLSENAFHNCTDLAGSLTLSDGLTEIGDNGFLGCQSLTGIVIPAGVEKIGKDAFYWCTGLTSIEVSEQNQNYASLDGVLFNKDKSELIAFPEGVQAENYSIPSGVTTIEDNAFFWCMGLRGVTMPNSIKAIGNSSFSYCGGLTGNLKIPEGVTAIGDEAFSFCQSLDGVDFYGDAPVRFGKHVFANGQYSFRITFDPSKSGWSVPDWNGYTVYPRAS